MCEEKLSLENIIDEEKKKIEEKYEKAESLIENLPSWKVHNTTKIDYETVKLMDLRRKKRNQIKELEREINDLNYEIGFKIGLEEGGIISRYQIANKLLEEDVPIKEIASETKLTMEQIKQLVQTI